jgi:hypothetical protein
MDFQSTVQKLVTEKENPFHDDFKNLLKKQTVLTATAMALQGQPMDVSLIVSTMYFTSNNLPVADKYGVLFNTNDNPELGGIIKSYFVMSLVVQTFENIETFIKDTLKKYIDLNINDAILLKYIKKKTLRPNEDIFAISKQLFPEIIPNTTANTLYKHSIDEYYRMLGLVRHSVVHLDQKPTEDLKNFIKQSSTVFDMYFTINQNENRIMVRTSMDSIISPVNTLGCALFEAVSKRNGNTINYESLY